MYLLFGIVLLLFAIAMAVLFAMIGELASRVPAPAEPDQSVRVYEAAQVGSTPSWWPAPIDAFIAQHHTAPPVLIVLSSSCNSCNTVAQQLAAARQGRLTDFAVLISCASAQRGQEFVDQHGLSAARHYIDVGGDWVTESFGIAMSPCALVLDESGALTTAFNFQDFNSLQRVLSQQPFKVEEGQSWTSVNTSDPADATSADEDSSAPSAPAV